MESQPKPRHIPYLHDRRPQHPAAASPKKKPSRLKASHPKAYQLLRPAPAKAQTCVSRLTAAWLRRAHTLQAGMHQQPTARPTSRIGQPSAYRSTFARISARLHTAGGRCAYYLATRHPGGEPGCLTSLTLGIPARRTKVLRARTRGRGFQQACWVAVLLQSIATRLARRHYIPQPRQCCCSKEASKVYPRPSTALLAS